MNMMKYCPECYKELPPNSVACPFCGYKTGNGDEEAPPDVLQTPQVDSYIPPEQTILGLLLLGIFFWGINIAISAMPFYLGIGTKRNLLIAIIASQVLTRVIIGLFAIEEISLKRKSKLKDKLGTFLLALIPVADIVPSLHASRTVIRKNRIPALSIACVVAVLMTALVLFKTSDQVAHLIKDGEIAALPEAGTATPLAELSSIETGTPLPEPTETFRPFINGCRNPLTVTADEEGDQLQVCGKITNFGVRDCKTCPLGYYSFLKLEDKFKIVSYEWRFTHAWLNKCVMVEDEVKLLADQPTFVFSSGEGCIGDCVHDFHGGLIDDNGVYFKPFEGCD